MEKYRELSLRPNETCIVSKKLDHRYCLLKDEENNSNKFVTECQDNGANLKIEYSGRVNTYIAPTNTPFCFSSVYSGISRRGSSKNCKIPEIGLALQGCNCFVKDPNFTGNDASDCYCEIQILSKPNRPSSAIEEVHYIRQNCTISRKNETDDIKVTSCRIQNGPFSNENLYFGVVDTSGNMNTDLLCNRLNPNNNELAISILPFLLWLFLPVLLLWKICRKENTKNTKRKIVRHKGGYVQL